MAASKRVCIIGANGMLGRELVQACQADELRGAVDLFTADIDTLDITRAADVSHAVAEWQPDVVINAAAYTDVDGCETETAQAFAVNADGPANLAAACRASGCRLVHVSTDFVFDGRRTLPYLPDDPVSPLSAYGKSKAEGDRRIRETLANHTIVRTSWLFGVHGKNFVKTMLRLATERDELRVVTDQVGCPTYAPDLARALLTLGFSGLTGTYHFCNAGACSWNEFATEIVRLGGLSIPVRPISSDELKRPAVRPASAVLSTQTLTQDTGIEPRPWKEALAECISQLNQTVACG